MTGRRFHLSIPALLALAGLATALLTPLQHGRFHPSGDHDHASHAHSHAHAHETSPASGSDSHPQNPSEDCQICRFLAVFSSAIPFVAGFQMPPADRLVFAAPAPESLPLDSFALASRLTRGPPCRA